MLSCHSAFAFAVPNIYSPRTVVTVFMLGPQAVTETAVWLGTSNRLAKLTMVVTRSAQSWHAGINHCQNRFLREATHPIVHEPSAGAKYPTLLTGCTGGKHAVPAARAVSTLAFSVSNLDPARKTGPHQRRPADLAIVWLAQGHRGHRHARNRC